MSTAISSTPTLSDDVIEEIVNTRMRILGPNTAERFWNRYLSQQDRDYFDNDLTTAYFNNNKSLARMWMKLRGITENRAIVEVGKKLGFLTVDTYEWLLRELGEPLNAKESMEHAIEAGHFVLLEQPREAYWNGEQIDIDWDKYKVLREFLWELGRNAKVRRPVDRLTFVDNDLGENLVANRKHRLTSMPEFPVDLGDLIEVVGRAAQQLKLPPEQIRIFESLDGSLREWKSLPR